MLALPRTTLALTVAALLAAAGSVRGGERKPPALAAPTAGPVATRSDAAPNAVEARDEAELARLLAEPGGPEEIRLLPRAYHGDFRLTRRVTLRGEPGTVLVGSGHGTVLAIESEGALVENLSVRHSGRSHTHEDAGIKATAPRVTIRRVHVEDALFGISLGPCQQCVVEKAYVRGTADEPELRGDAIKLWEASDSRVQGCVVEDSRDLVVWYSRRVQLLDNWVTRSRYGTHFMYAHDSHVKNSHFVDNVVGVFVMYSGGLRIEGSTLAGARGAAGMGVGFKESDGVSLERNWLVANTTGVYLDRTPRSPDKVVRLSGNVLALNDTALSFHSSEHGVEFHGNDFRRNHVPVEVEGGGDATGVDFKGNYWSDYVGYDLDGDSVGDVAYDVKRLASAIDESNPSVRLLDGTLAFSLIDLVARAVPVFSSERLLSDPAPSVKPLGVLQ